MNIHEKYIKRCIEIAKNGLGTTRPNPMVGSVIVHKDSIIGEGFTSKYGGNHAEVNAIDSVQDKSLLNQATLYVTLEPCSHYGKTPPCSDLIITHNIPRVIIGCVDDNKKVAGKGIERLKNAGCEVIVGVLENACKEHHKRFFTFHNKKRPYVILKWAETKDGFVAPANKDTLKPVWITNEYSRQLVHKWRAEEHAVLVGTKTVLDDNPSLTVRDWTGENPIRIVIDIKNELSAKYNVLNNEVQTILINSKLINKSQGNTAEQILNLLFENEITSVIIEGGSKTLQTFIDANFWDEARVFIGDALFKEGVKAPVISGKLLSERFINRDVLKKYLND
ncbi:MAG TPA: bifunctional diaminohydroxyphosphoribosylaminopyrimidine deaminase/5-amino-6-(5-phosphoribosylamino)uracil reductase RibD [Yeosuana sp.]